MDWLPSIFPRNVRCVISAVTDGRSARILFGEQRTPHPVPLHLGDLDESARQEIVKHTLGKYNKVFFCSTLNLVSLCYNYSEWSAPLCRRFEECCFPYKPVKKRKKKQVTRDGEETAREVVLESQQNVKQLSKEKRHDASYWIPHKDWTPSGSQQCFKNVLHFEISKA